MIINDVIDFEKYLVYDETSPSCLRWKIDVKTGKGVGRNIVNKGDVAGCLHATNNYWSVCINGTHYKAHRVIYQIHYKDLSQLDYIDHIYGMTNDNRINMLRKKTSQENAQNQCMYSNNNSGKTGVFWQNKKGRNGIYSALYAYAQWYVSLGIKKSKSFSVKKLGLLPAFAMACQYRDEKILELNAQGAQYTDRHGK